MTLSADERSQVRGLARGLYRDSPRVARALDPSDPRSNTMRYTAGIASMLMALGLIFVGNLAAALVAAALGSLGAHALRPFMD